MNIDLTKDELKILVSALDVKVREQWDKLSNPHLDPRFVTTYKALHNDATTLHIKLLRNLMDNVDTNGSGVV